jgi:hypothetical protein
MRPVAAGLGRSPVAESTWSILRTIATTCGRKRKPCFDAGYAWWLDTAELVKMASTSGHLRLVKAVPMINGHISTDSTIPLEPNLTASGSLPSVGFKASPKRTVKLSRLRNFVNGS